MPQEQHRTFPARFKSLADIDRFVADAAEQAGFEHGTVYQIQLAVDEACSNIIEHAYGGEGPGTIECSLRTEEEALTIALRDHGKPFEPECVPAPDVDADLEERTGGGLGLFFIRQMMDEVTFDFSLEEGNVLTLVKRKGSGCSQGDRD